MEFFYYLQIAVVLIAIGFILNYLNRYLSYDRCQEKVIQDDNKNDWEVDKLFYLEGQNRKRGVLKKAGIAFMLLIIFLLIFLISQG